MKTLIISAFKTVNFAEELVLVYQDAFIQLCRVPAPFRQAACLQTSVSVFVLPKEAKNLLILSFSTYLPKLSIAGSIFGLYIKHMKYY